MTIPKNTKRAREAIENARDIRCFSLSNNFSGSPLTERPVRYVTHEDADGRKRAEPQPMTQQQFLRNELLMYHAKLTENNGRYTIQIHSNLWYEFQSEEPHAS